MSQLGIERASRRRAGLFGIVVAALHIYMLTLPPKWFDEAGAGNQFTARLVKHSPEQGYGKVPGR